MFHLESKTNRYGYGWFESREEAEARKAEIEAEFNNPPADLTIREGDEFEGGYLNGGKFTIRQRAFELRNAAGETIGIIGKPRGRGSDLPVAYQLKHGRLSSTYTGMSLYYALTNYGKGGPVEPGAAFYIQGPDHEKRYGAIVEAVPVQ